MEETVYFAIPNPVERQTIIYSREGYQQVNDIGVPWDRVSLDVYHSLLPQVSPRKFDIF